MSRNSDNTLIYYPVNTWDVAKVTRKGSGDVGVLCGANQMINIWAKYKPVIYANLINTYDQLNSDMTWKSTATWWQGDDGKCGLTVNKRTNGTALTDNWDNEWVYNPPTGGLAAPYRLIDFNYYDHSATELLSVSTPAIYYTNSDDGLWVNFAFNTTNEEYKLLITDFVNAKGGLFGSQSLYPDLYCGVLVAYGQSAYATCTKVWATNPNAIGKDMTASDEGNGKWNRTVIVPKNQMPSGSTPYVTIYPYIAATVYNSTRTKSSADAEWEVGVVACPVNPIEITAAMSSIAGEFVADSIVCEALASGGGFDITFTYKVTGYGDFTAYVDPYVFVLDADPDTSETYPEESKIQRYHILNYGEQVNNPQHGSGYIISLNDASENYNQNTVLGRTGTAALTIGVDSASYISNYKTKHGTTNAKIRICVVLGHESYYWYDRYYTQTVSNEITIT